MLTFAFATRDTPTTITTTLYRSRSDYFVGAAALLSSGR